MIKRILRWRTTWIAAGNALVILTCAVTAYINGRADLDLWALAILGVCTAANMFAGTLFVHSAYKQGRLHEKLKQHFGFDVEQRHQIIPGAPFPPGSIVTPQGIHLPIPTTQRVNVTLIGGGGGGGGGPNP